MDYRNIGSIRIKHNGKWVFTNSFYKKVNGSWVAITIDECQSILQANNCKKLTNN